MAKSKRPPLGVIAYYGPDNTRATKLVVSIMGPSPDEAPEAMYTWTVEEGDIREDATISAERRAALSRHRVKHVSTAPHIMGCAHEEGIDYPLGRTCPQCPFWATFNRWTNEPLQETVPDMPAEQVLAELSRPDPIDPPFEALESANAHRAVLTEPLLEALARRLDSPPFAGGPEEPAGDSHAVADDPQAAAGGADLMLAQYALYLLATWRETRAYPLVLRWLSLPGDAARDLFDDDILMEDGGRILASVCDSNLEPIQALVLNREANAWCRAAAVRALGLLGAWAEVPGEPIVEWFVWLADEGLEREPSAVWQELAASSIDIEAVPVFEHLRRAFDEGLIDSNGVSPRELDLVETDDPGNYLERTREAYPPFEDLGEAVASWSQFDHLDDDDRVDGDLDGIDPDHLHDWDDDSDESVDAGDQAGPWAPAAVETRRAPQKVGRNEPCPCGSGRKYKKCCGA